VPGLKSATPSRDSARHRTDHGASRRVSPLRRKATPIRASIERCHAARPTSPPASDRARASWKNRHRRTVGHRGEKPPEPIGGS
jgi:hypothetical protein